MRCLATLLLGAVAIQNTRPRSRSPLAEAAAQTRVISFGDDDDLVLTLEYPMEDDTMKLTATAKTTGFLAFGFAHEREHEEEETVYDVFVGGVVDDGDDAYGASYTMKGSKLTRTEEDRYKVISGGQTSGGSTTVTATRTFSLCYWESFSSSDVGDSALVYFILGKEDLGETHPMPEEITLASSVIKKEGVVKSTLFSGSMDLTEEVSEDDDANKLDFALDDFDPEGAVSACVVASTDKDVEYFVGFQPHLKVSTKGCRDGPLANINVMCQDLLFVYTRGNLVGEQMPDGYGIRANPADEDGNRHFMLLTVFADSFDGQFSDRSGVTAFAAPEDGDDLEEAGKLLVGHHLSSKMAVLPAKGWVVQGVCHSGCTGADGVTDQEKVKILAASLHYGESAISATLKISQDDPDSEVDVFRHLITDDPTVRDFSPSNRDLRHLDAELDLSVGDVVVECSFHADALRHGDADARADSEFCFGTLTLSKPLALSTCTSVPTEEGLARAIGRELAAYLDGTGTEEGRRRRKRQAPAVLDRFYDREVKGGDEGDTVGDVLEAMADAAKESSAAATDYNGNFLLAKALPICVRSSGELVDLEPVEILRLEPAEVARAVTQAECDALKFHEDADAASAKDLDPAVKTSNAEEQNEGEDSQDKKSDCSAAQCWVTMIFALATVLRIL